MSQSKYLIIKFKSASKNHAVRICVGVIVEYVSVVRKGKHYFLVFGECEIRFTLKVLENVVNLVNSILTQEVRTFIP